jgi:hypothetical protein
MRCPWGYSKREFSDGQYTKEEKQYILWYFANGKMNFRKWLTIHKIPYTTVKEWQNLVSNGSGLQDRRGKPDHLDDLALEKLIEIMDIFPVDGSLAKYNEYLLMLKM